MCCEEIFKLLFNNHPFKLNLNMMTNNSRMQGGYICYFAKTLMCWQNGLLISSLLCCNIGNAKNPFTDEQFEGPCYIPWTVFKLQITVSLIIYVIPHKNIVQAKFISSRSEFEYLIGDTPSPEKPNNIGFCTQHDNKELSN